MSNLFIAYDLMSPGQNYDRVQNAIKALGAWHQFQYSLFYVHTNLTAAQACDYMLTFMDASDRLAVIDANNGFVTTWDKPPIAEISAIWTTP